MNGFFITFEGIDGSGKSTQADLLNRALVSQGRDVIRTAEPGGWPSGQALRDLILHGDIPDARTEFLLFMADRSAHVSSVICPALTSGKIVICERYTDSTLAYQVYGRGFNKRRALAMLNVCGFPEPDLTIYLKISPEDAASRLATRRGADQNDRIETSGLAFMQRVANGFDRLIDEKYSLNALTVDAGVSKSVEDTAREIATAVTARLPRSE